MWHAPPAWIRLALWVPIIEMAQSLWGWDTDTHNSFSHSMQEWASRYGYWPFGIHGMGLNNPCISTIIPLDEYQFVYKADGTIHHFKGRCFQCNQWLMARPFETDPFMLMCKMAEAQEKGWYVYQP
jgi:hypothetical protein